MIEKLASSSQLKLICSGRFAAGLHWNFSSTIFCRKFMILESAVDDPVGHKNTEKRCPNKPGLSRLSRHLSLSLSLSLFLSLSRVCVCVCVCVFILPSNAMGKVHQRDWCQAFQFETQSFEKSERRFCIAIVNVWKEKRTMKATDLWKITRHGGRKKKHSGGVRVTKANYSSPTR